VRCRRRVSFSLYTSHYCYRSGISNAQSSEILQQEHRIVSWSVPIRRWVLAYVKSQWLKLNFAVAYFDGTTSGRAAYRLMKDQWDEMLRCPNCRKSGIASLRYEKSEEMPTVHSVPDGFKVVDTQFGPPSIATLK
jgi:hypothetical protein